MMGWKAQGAASYQADTLDVITNMLSNGKAGISTSTSTLR